MIHLNILDNIYSIKNLDAAIEAILFASGDAVSISKLVNVLNVSEDSILCAAEKLSKRLEIPESGIKLIKLDDKFQLCTKAEFSDKIREIMNIKKRTPLSQAAMEIIAIVAYNQPVTKSFIEQVRGVDCSKIISNLIEKSLIEEKGRLDLPGKPLIYGTTDNFLKCFQLEDLNHLPNIEDINK